MPSCEIDVDGCPKFLLLVKRLRAKYPTIGRDLEDAFEKIEPDYATAAGAATIPGWEGIVWRHRCGNSDMQASGDGFRIISVVVRDRASHVLYPVLIYPEADQPDPTGVEVAAAVRALERELKTLQDNEPSTLR